jgi:hypothetical protein
MCDYSLHHLRSRPAKVGDKLTVSYFGHPLGTRGFAAPEDEYLAVCLLPGTELSFANEVRRETPGCHGASRSNTKPRSSDKSTKKGPQSIMTLWSSQTARSCC